jgi:hypothetical protein
MSRILTSSSVSPRKRETLADSKLPYSCCLSDQHYLQEETSSEPRLEVLLVFGESDKTLEFYSGQVGKEFDRNE